MVIVEPLQPSSQDLSQALAHEANPQDGEDHGQARKDTHPGGGGQVLFVLRKHINNDEKVNAVEKKVDLEMNEAIEFGKSSPDPSVEEFLAGIQD